MRPDKWRRRQNFFLAFLILKRILTFFQKNHQLFDQKIINFFSCYNFFSEKSLIFDRQKIIEFFSWKTEDKVGFLSFLVEKWILKFCTTDRFLIIGAILIKINIKILGKNQFLFVGANLQSQLWTAKVKPAYRGFSDLLLLLRYEIFFSLIIKSTINMPVWFVVVIDCARNTSVWY